MKPAPRASARVIARQREQREVLRRETAEAERVEELARSEREAAAVRQLEERDRRMRQRAYEVSERLAAARRAAEDAEIDFEGACSQLAAGKATADQAESLQLERDAARRTLEIWELAAGEMRADAVLVGRR